MKAPLRRASEDFVDLELMDEGALREQLPHNQLNHRQLRNQSSIVYHQSDSDSDYDYAEE